MSSSSCNETINNNKNRPYFMRLALLSTLSFFTGWVDVLTLVRYQTFVSAMTGNLVFFGASIAPPEVKHTADVSNPPYFYIGVILCNLCGSFILRWLKLYIPKSRSGTALAALTVIFAITGELIFHYCDDNERLGAMALAPIFGAVNAFSMAPPFATNTGVMTGNLQKIPKWIVNCIKERKFLRIEHGCLQPLATLLGCATVAGILWIGNRQFYLSLWSFAIALAGIAITAVLCDVLYPHLIEPKEPTNNNDVEKAIENNNETKNNDERSSSNDDTTNAINNAIVDVNDDNSDLHLDSLSVHVDGIELSRTGIANIETTTQTISRTDSLDTVVLDTV